MNVFLHSGIGRVQFTEEFYDLFQGGVRGGVGEEVRMAFLLLPFSQTPSA